MRYREDKSSTMLENWQGKTSSIQKTKNLKNLCGVKLRKISRKSRFQTPLPCKIREHSFRVSSSLAFCARQSCRAAAVPKESSEKSFEASFCRERESSILLLITRWCINLCQYSKRWKFWMRRRRWIRNGRSSRKFLRGRWIKWRAKRMLFLKHKKRKRKSTLLHWWTFVISRIAKKNQKHQKYKGRIVLRGDSERWFWCTRSIHRTRIVSLANDSAKAMDVIARLPGCAGQAADAVSAHTQVKMEDAPRLLKISKSECAQKCGYVFHDPSGPNHGHTWKTQSFLLNEILYAHPFAGLSWEGRFEEVLLGLGWDKVPNWKCLFGQRRQRFVLVGVRRWFWNGWKTAEHGSIVEEIDGTCWSWRTTSFLDHVYFRTKTVSVNIEMNFCYRNSKITRVGETSRKNCRVVLRHGRPCEKVRGEVLWTGKQKDGAIVHSFNALLGWSQLHEGGLGNSQRIVPRWSWTACTWHSVVD